jgi:hypothetical protein
MQIRIKSLVLVTVLLSVSTIACAPIQSTLNRPSDEASPPSVPPDSRPISQVNSVNCPQVASIVPPAPAETPSNIPGKGGGKPQGLSLPEAAPVRHSPQAQANNNVCAPIINVGAPASLSNSEPADAEKHQESGKDNKQNESANEKLERASSEIGFEAKGIVKMNLKSADRPLVYAFAALFAIMVITLFIRYLIRGNKPKEKKRALDVIAIAAGAAGLAVLAAWIYLSSHQEQMSAAMSESLIAQIREVVAPLIRSDSRKSTNNDDLATLRGEVASRFGSNTSELQARMSYTEMRINSLESARGNKGNASLVLGTISISILGTCLLAAILWILSGRRGALIPEWKASNETRSANVDLLIKAAYELECGLRRLLQEFRLASTPPTSPSPNADNAVHIDVSDVLRSMYSLRWQIETDSASPLPEKIEKTYYVGPLGKLEGPLKKVLEVLLRRRSVELRAWRSTVGAINEALNVIGESSTL